MKRFVLLAVPLAVVLWCGRSRAAGQAEEAQPSQAASSERHSPAPPAPEAAASPNKHRVSVNFDYDFTKNPPCPAKESSPAVSKPPSKALSKKDPKDAPAACIKQFDVYDVSGGKFRLFSIPVPPGAKGFLKGIGGTSPPRVFEPGLHFIAVTAEDEAGHESAIHGSQTTVQIPPASPPGAPAAPKP